MSRGFVYGHQQVGYPGQQVGAPPAEIVYTGANPAVANQAAIPGPTIIHTVVGGASVPAPMYSTVGQPPLHQLPPSPSVPEGGAPGITAPAFGYGTPSFGGGSAQPVAPSTSYQVPSPYTPAAQPQAAAPVAPQGLMGMVGTPLSELDGILAGAANALANTQAGNDPAVVGQFRIAAQVLSQNGYTRLAQAVDLWAKTRGVQVAGNRFRSLGYADRSAAPRSY